MKYQKPQSRSLNEISFASGACASGQYVGTCVNNSGFLAGYCSQGLNAGSGNCQSGSTPTDACTTGNFGQATNCTNGQFAAP